MNFRRHIADFNAGICRFGGGGGGTTTSNTVTQPWSGQQPYLTTAFSQANNLFDNYTPQYFQGNTVAQFSPQQNTAITDITKQATTGEPITQSAMNFATNLQNGNLEAGNAGNNEQAGFASGDMLPTSTNPYFSNLNSSIAASVLPGIEAQFANGNSLNNPAAAYAASSGLTTALAQPAYAAYEQGLQQEQTAQQNRASNYNTGLQLGTSSLLTAPSIQQMPYNDANALFGAGSAEQQQNQTNTNANIAQWNYNQQLPYSKLNQFLSQIGGTGYGGSSSTTTPYFGNTGANALSGGIGGALGGSALFSAFPQTLGSLGLTSGGASAVGGGLGALLALL
jgi:hypothetical protein